MRLPSGLLLVAAFLTDPSRAAPTADCRRGTNQVERAICTNSGLRRADTAMGQAYANVLRHTDGHVRAGFIAQQRTWLASRDAACAGFGPDCLSKAYTGRQAQMDALTARIASSDLSLLNDTVPLVLSGSWKAGVPRVLGRPTGKPAVDLGDAAADDGLPDAGTVVTGRPGRLCYGADCFAAGLEPIRLSTVYSDERAAALGIPPKAPAYQVTLTTAHVIRLVRDRTGALLAVFDACARLHAACITAVQDWSPQDGNATIRELSDGGPAAGPDP